MNSAELQNKCPIRPIRLIGPILLLSLFVVSCAPASYPSQCWQASLAAAVIMQSHGYQAEITIQRTEKPGIYHAQVRAWDPEAGRWRWVVIDGAWPQVTWGSREAGEVVEVKSEEWCIETARSKVRQ